MKSAVFSEMISHKTKFRSACVILIVSIFYTLFIYSRKNKSPQQIEQVNRGPTEIGRNRQLASAYEQKGVETKVASFTDEQDLRMSAATTALLKTCNEVEVENSSAFFRRRLTGREISCIAISPPTAEQIGNISKTMASHLGRISTNDEIYRELHRRLMVIYNERVIFRKSFRVLHFEQADDGNGLRLSESDYDSLDSAVPSESGTIKSQGHVSIYDLNMNAWKMRYGHILPIRTHPD